jgi:hypothetical protein
MGSRDNKVLRWSRMLTMLTIDLRKLYGRRTLHCCSDFVFPERYYLPVGAFMRPEDDSVSTLVLGRTR